MFCIFVPISLHFIPEAVQSLNYPFLQCIYQPFLINLDLDLGVFSREIIKTLSVIAISISTSKKSQYINIMYYLFINYSRWDKEIYLYKYKSLLNYRIEIKVELILINIWSDYQLQLYHLFQQH
jgi:hypothetical protein